MFTTPLLISAWDTSLPEPRNKLQLPLEARDTGELLGYLNILIDVFNGKVRNDESSIHRTLLSDSSYHMDFFCDTRKKLSKMRFVDRVTHKPVARQPPFLHNLI